MLTGGKVHVCTCIIICRWAAEGTDGKGLRAHLCLLTGGGRGMVCRQGLNMCVLVGLSEEGI